MPEDDPCFARPHFFDECFKKKWTFQEIGYKVIWGTFFFHTFLIRQIKEIWWITTLVFDAAFGGGRSKTSTV